jgi:voltage-gated potassium channel
MVELPLTVLALVWLPVLIAPLVAQLPKGLADLFNAMDYFVWAAFVFDYLVRLYLVPSRLHFVKHHVVDLAVIVLPMLRPLRALRLLRLLNVARAGLVFANAALRLRSIITHRGLHVVLLAAMGIVFLCAALELAFEQNQVGSTIQNYGDALWWAIVTATTVGYGDKYPSTAGGRGVAVVLMLVGIGLIGVITASVASYFVEEKATEDAAGLSRRLDRIEAMLARVLGAADGTTRTPDVESREAVSERVTAEPD